LLSARELQAEVEEANNKMMTEYKQMAGINRNYLVDSLPEEIRKKMENMLKKEDRKEDGKEIEDKEEDKKI